MNYTVEVWGEQCEVSVTRKSKSVFIASGTYMGQDISAQGRSPGAAVASWQRQAHRYGDSGVCAEAMRAATKKEL